MRKCFIAWLLGAAGLWAQPAPPPEAGAFGFLQTRGAAADEHYQRGQQALNQSRWDEAAAEFDAAAKGSQPDRALYYKAYALNKLGRRDDALATLAQLRTAHPSSRWLDDAKALELEIRQAAGQKVSPDSQPDEDLKLMAINGLMNSDPARAIPLLEGILSGAGSPKLKERALFVLAQANTPQARDILLRFARGSGNPEMQSKALRYIAVSGMKDKGQLLAQVYAGTQNEGLKREVLKDFMISGDRQRLLEAARTEKSAAVRVDAIRLLGVSGGQDELWQLYQQEPSPEVKASILKSMFVGGNSARLLEVARSEPNAKLRAAAIHSLGIMGSKTSADLAGLYAAEKDPALKRDIINALFIQNSAKPLVDLARRESDAGLKKDIVQKLSLMHSKEAEDYMLELLK